MKNAIGTVKVWPNRVMIVTSRMWGPGKKRLLSMMKLGPPARKEHGRIQSKHQLSLWAFSTYYDMLVPKLTIHFYTIYIRQLKSHTHVHNI